MGHGVGELVEKGKGIEQKTTTKTEKQTIVQRSPVGKGHRRRWRSENKR